MLLILLFIIGFLSFFHLDSCCTSVGLASRRWIHEFATTTGQWHAGPWRWGEIRVAVRGRGWLPSATSPTVRRFAFLLLFVSEEVFPLEMERHPGPQRGITRSTRKMAVSTRGEMTWWYFRSGFYGWLIDFVSWGTLFIFLVGSYVFTVDWLIDLFVEGSIDCSTDWLIDASLINKFAVHCLVGISLFHSFDWSIILRFLLYCDSLSVGWFVVEGGQLFALRFIDLCSYLHWTIDWLIGWLFLFAGACLLVRRFTAETLFSFQSSATIREADRPTVIS